MRVGASASVSASACALRKASAALATLACAALLAGCGATGGKSPHTDDLNSQKGESGVTVFGTIDVGAGSQRSR